MTMVRAISTEAGYRGCGRAWAAVDSTETVVALRYMDAGTQQAWPVPEGQPDYRALTASDYGAYKQQMHDELAPLGAVVSGMCSGWEFVS